MDTVADVLRDECVCRRCFACLQHLAKLQADMKALQDELKSTLRDVYRSVDMPVLGKHSHEAETEASATEYSTPTRK